MTSALNTCALVDTSVLIDAMKMGERRRAYAALRQRYSETIATDIVQLEYKAVLIGTMITIHSQLRHFKRFTSVRDRLCESTHPQHRLRSHIFNNYVNVHCSSFADLSEEDEAELANQARLLLEAQIPRAYKDFYKLIDSIHSLLGCDRAIEPPKLLRAAFEPNLPLCKRGKNKTCDVEAFVRARCVPLCDALTASVTPDASPQIGGAVRVFRDIQADAAADVNHRQCRTAGDCLIGIAAAGRATHALSTNGREWEPLCRVLGLQFDLVSYDSA